MMRSSYDYFRVKALLLVSFLSSFGTLPVARAAGEWSVLLAPEGPHRVSVEYSSKSGKYRFYADPDHRALYEGNFSDPNEILKLQKVMKEAGVTELTRIGFDLEFSQIKGPAVTIGELIVATATGQIFSKDYRRKKIDLTRNHTVSSCVASPKKLVNFDNLVSHFGQPEGKGQNWGGDRDNPTQYPDDVPRSPPDPTKFHGAIRISIPNDNGALGLPIFLAGSRALQGNDTGYTSGTVIDGYITDNQFKMRYHADTKLYTREAGPYVCCDSDDRWQVNQLMDEENTVGVMFGRNSEKGAYLEAGVAYKEQLFDQGAQGMADDQQRRWHEIIMAEDYINQSTGRKNSHGLAFTVDTGDRGTVLDNHVAYDGTAGVTVDTRGKNFSELHGQAQVSLVSPDGHKPVVIYYRAVLYGDGGAVETLVGVEFEKEIHVGGDASILASAGGYKPLSRDVKQHAGWDDKDSIYDFGLGFKF